MDRFAPVLLVLVFLVGCGGSAAQVKKRNTPVQTKVAVIVEQHTTWAPGLRDQVAGDLRQMIMDTGNGVLVTDPKRADVRLHVKIEKANTTNATQWEWQLVDVASGDIVVSRADTSGWGLSAHALASGIVNELNKVDTTPYIRAKAPDVPPGSFPIATSKKPADTVKSATDGSNAWAVIVGVEHYRDDLPAATGAEADAASFARFAEKTLNVPEANVKVLTGNRATRADVMAAIKEWLPRNAVAPGGRVYVYFSGHGAPDTKGGSYLLPYDANPTYVKTSGVAVSDLLGTLKKLHGQQVYVFLDACFSGRGARSVIAKGTRPLIPVKNIKASGETIAFSAAGAKETTGVKDGHGLFTYHLLAGLEGKADANGDGDVTASELQDYLVAHVSKDARRQNREQNPTAVGPSGFLQAVLVHGLAD